MIGKFAAITLCLALAAPGGPGARAQDLEAHRTGELTHALRDETAFIIKGSHNLGGTIGIVARTGNQIDVSFTTSARAESRAQAERYLDLVDLRLGARGDERVTLEILAPSDAPWEGTEHAATIDIIVGLPEKMRIEGDLRLLAVSVSGPFGGVRLRSQFSAIAVDGTRGEVDVSTAFSPVALSGIEGSVRAETRYAPIGASGIAVALGSAVFKTVNGAITLEGIQGPVEAYTSYSTIRARDIDAADGSVVFRTSYSPINIDDVAGELICETSFSPINVHGIALTHGQSKLETSYSPIEAEFGRIEGSQLIIYNSYNNIRLTLPPGVSAQLIADVDPGGRIHASGVPIRPVYLDASRMEGLVGEGENRIELKVDGVGTIDIEGR